MAIDETSLLPEAGLQDHGQLLEVDGEWLEVGRGAAAQGGVELVGELAVAVPAPLTELAGAGVGQAGRFGDAEDVPSGVDFRA